MPELTAQQRKEREADNEKERASRRAVQTYTSAESHADGEALHLNRASPAPLPLQHCRHRRYQCIRTPSPPPFVATRRLQRVRQAGVHLAGAGEQAAEAQG